ncbi:unnamed protein product [Mycena citricolor]|uniref:Uncharacterized protein n=1 Tax=Mycena citricolor TaxID=2018698 RepID=A0AAD2H2K1_9AGAR|nr:unnamed protein product [Mycena citricolor]
MSAFEQTLEDLPLKTIRAYRDYMFPAMIATYGHDPYFPIDSPHVWMTSLGFQIYLQDDNSELTHVDPSEAPRRDLVRFRDAVLQMDYRTHHFFSLENVDLWILPKPFGTFLRTLANPRAEGLDNSDRNEHDCASVLSEIEPNESEYGSRPSSSMSGSIYPPSDNESYNPGSLSEISRPASSLSVHSEISNITHLSGVSSSIGMPDAPPRLPDDSSPAHRPAIKQRKRQRENHEGMVQITRELWVHELCNITEVPETWVVSRPDHLVAWLVDMSESVDLLRDASGDFLPFQAFLRAEDQDSWGGKGSAGRPEGDVDVLALLPGKKIRSRRAQWGCSGLRKCEFLDPSILEDCERYDVDPAGMKQLWDLVLDANEREGESVWSVIARFYRFVTELKCKGRLRGELCPGIAKMVAYSKVIEGGNTYFIGCSEWSPQQTDRRGHIFHKIPPHVDEILLKHALEHGGLIPNSPTTNNLCCFTAHPRFSLLNCGYSHIINGEIFVGKMIPHPCPTEILVFTPVNPPPGLEHKAIVHVRNPHTHPIYPRTKPRSVDRQRLNAAIDATGAGIGGLTVQKLLNASTTTALYSGKRVNESSPAYQDKRLVRNAISKKRTEKNPMGFGWEGVVFRNNTVDRKLPANERYIHSVISKADFRLAVTMNSSIMQYIHRMRAIMFDYSYKRVNGDINECEAVGFSNFLSQRITLGSIYGDGLDTNAYVHLFTEFWDSVESSTGCFLKLAPFYPDGKLKVIVLDGDIAQAMGLGIFLSRYNKPEISGIQTTDPVELLSYCLKMCTVHFKRHIDELPKTIPLATISRIKAILTLKSQADLDSWHAEMQAQTDSYIKNWYEHKRRNPLVLRAVNQYLSNIPAEIWNTTPDDTNYVESAHAARNAETSIRLTPLHAIEMAEERDRIRAAELIQIEQEAVVPRRNNGLFSREKLGLQRKEWKMRQTQDRTDQLTTFDHLTAQRELNRSAQKSSLEREKEIKEEIKKLQRELELDRRRADHKLTIKNLRDDISSEESHRRELRFKRDEIDSKLAALRSGPLAGVRVHGRRSNTGDTFDTISVDDEPLDHDLRPISELVSNQPEFADPTHRYSPEGNAQSEDEAAFERSPPRDTETSRFRGKFLDFNWDTMDIDFTLEDYEFTEADFAFMRSLEQGNPTHDESSLSAASHQDIILPVTMSPQPLPQPQPQPQPQLAVAVEHIGELNLADVSVGNIVSTRRVRRTRDRARDNDIGDNVGSVSSKKRRL